MAKYLLIALFLISNTATPATLGQHLFIDGIMRRNPKLPEAKARAYARAIYLEARSNSLDPSLLFAVASVESGFKEEAVGSVGEIGLMQLRPEYFAPKALNKAGKRQYLQNPSHNIAIAAKHIKSLAKQFKGRYPGVKFMEHYNRGASCKVRTFVYASKIEEALNDLHYQGNRPRTAKRN